MKDKIKKLHESDTLGIFVEMGCGTAVTSALYSVPGASATVFFAESPYSKVKQEELFGPVDRAVSIQRVESVLDTYWTKYVRMKAMSKINTVYAATFQIDDGDGSKATHGWIGICNHTGSKFYHVTIPTILERDEMFKLIAEQGIALLSGEIPQHVDIVTTHDGQELSDNAKIIENFSDSNVVCFSGGQMTRPEDVLRGHNRLLLYKGSFNPMHVGHMEIINDVAAQYGAKVILGLSAHPYGKEDLSGTDIAARAIMLNGLGFDVAVFRSGYFNDNQKVLRRVTKSRIVYVVGSDTMDRILKSSYHIIGENDFQQEIDRMRQDFNDSSFCVFDRLGDPAEYKSVADKFAELVITKQSTIKKISSTEIRDAIARGDHEFADKHKITKR